MTTLDSQIRALFAGMAASLREIGRAFAQLRARLSEVLAQTWPALRCRSRGGRATPLAVNGHQLHRRYRARVRRAR